MKETTKTYIRGFITGALLVVLLSLLTSCKAYTRAVGAGGNPDPNMKSIHMATNHSGYTIEDYNQHPDHDCDQDQTPYVLIADL